MAHDLPLPDYDGLPLGAIESRTRTLDEVGVGELLDYEQTHANRVQVVQLLEQRLLSLRRGAAEPSGGSPIGLAPETTGTSAEGPEQAAPASEGPPQNPPAHGVPTNPAQPRT
jgi:hypothetical protein